jgi:hypothetical protein
MDDYRASAGSDTNPGLTFFRGAAAFLAESRHRFASLGVDAFSGALSQSGSSGLCSRTTRSGSGSPGPALGRLRALLRRGPRFGRIVLRGGRLRAGFAQLVTMDLSGRVDAVLVSPDIEALDSVLGS